MAAIKNILHITPFFTPNIGGVETHLTDLINELDHLNYKNIVLTYSPLSTPNTKWKAKESHGKHSQIYRFKWFAGNLFHRLEKYPLINLLYITPYLLIRSTIYLSTKHPRIDVIHSHGINGAIIGIFLKKLFKIKKHITSIYSTYDNVPLNSFSTKFMVNILNHCDVILTQSDISVSQLKNMGVNPNKISRYYHWIDLNKFKPIPTKNKKFSVLFIGRMIPQKGTLLLAKVAKKLPKIDFIFVGTGPDYPKLTKISQNTPNIKLVGNVAYENLNQYYQKASLLCVPSKYKEGWWRIIAESIACATPVISSNLGATVEAADTSVAIFIKPTLNNFIKEINNLYLNRSIYRKLKNNCRSYALNHYSSKNISYITKNY